MAGWLWPSPVLRLEPGLHGALVGGTGTGKTTFMQWLLHDAPGVVVYDAKYITPGKEVPGEWQCAPGYQVVGHPAEATEGRVVLRVPASALRDTAGWKVPGSDGWWWTEALKLPMLRGETVIVYDEALGTLPANGAHHGAHEHLQWGRASGILTVVGSQLANNIDTRVLRMAHWLICFRTTNGTEIGHLQHSLSGIDCSMLTKLRKRRGRRGGEFAYHDVTMDDWRVFRPVDLKRPGFLREKPQHSWWRRKRWLLGWWLLAVMIAAGGGMTAAMALCALITYLVLRADRALRWRVVVECGIPNLSTAVEAQPAEAPDVLPFRRPSRRRVRVS